MLQVGAPRNSRTPPRRGAGAAGAPPYCWVDTHFVALYTTTLMAKTDLAGGPRSMREPRSRRSWVYWVLATLVLLAGFADLARGGETLAPILLVIGYCVLVPLAILR